MPRGQPFTRMCQQAAILARPSHADLHVHTSYSDGAYTPTQLVARAHTHGLAAIAVTDHDTTAGWATAVEAAREIARDAPEIIPGVEISVEHRGELFHLLGLFVDGGNLDLQTGLGRIRAARRERFFEMLKLLGITRRVLENPNLAWLLTGELPLGRRHLAAVIIQCGHARNRQEAFSRWINLLPEPGKYSANISDALRWIHGAGGLSSLAHPDQRVNFTLLGEFASMGLQAVEANAPSITAARSMELRKMADSLGLSVTAGSDFHDEQQSLGSRCITLQQLATLRERRLRQASQE